MARHAAIGIDDDLASGQATVAVRAPDHKPAGRVNKVFGVCVTPRCRQNRFDDFFHHRFLQILQGDAFLVLGREHHGIDSDRLAVFIPEGQLALGVRLEPVQLAAFAHV